MPDGHALSIGDSRKGVVHKDGLLIFGTDGKAVRNCQLFM